MPASGSSSTLSIANGSDADSQTMLQIVRVGDTTLEAHVIRDGREITAERPASAFNWTRVSGSSSVDASWNNAHKGMKQIALTAAETTGGMQFEGAEYRYIYNFQGDVEALLTPIICLW